MAFLAGVYFLVGIKGTMNFFFKNKKGTLFLIGSEYLGRIKGTALYFGGFLMMVILRFAFIGFVTQIAGILIVFRDFLPWLKSYTFAIPVVGKYLSEF